MLGQVEHRKGRMLLVQVSRRRLTTEQSTEQPLMMATTSIQYKGKQQTVNVYEIADSKESGDLARTFVAGGPFKAREGGGVY